MMTLWNFNDPIMYSKLHVFKPVPSINMYNALDTRLAVNQEELWSVDYDLASESTVA